MPLELIWFAGLLIPLGLILLLVVAITTTRTDPDPVGERPAALYYAGVLFITVFTVLFSVFAAVSSLLNLTIDEDDFSSSQFRAVSESIRVSPTGEVSGDVEDLPSVSQFSSDGNAEDDEDWRDAVLALIVGTVGAGLYWFHDRRRRQRGEGAVAARVRTTYLYAVSFVSVIVGLFATVTALYAVFKVIAPGVTEAGTRGEASVEFAQAGVLAVLAGLLFLWHLRTAEPGAGAIGIAPVVPPEPPGPPPVDLKPAPKPRKKRTAPLKAQGRSR